MSCFGLVFISGLLLLGHKTASVTLVWDPVCEPGIVGYRVYYTDMTGHRAAKAKSLDVVLATRAVVPKLIVGHTYYFAVTAIDSKGRESAPSALVKYVVVPPK